jgi:RNA polymerase sigma-70 factor (ECF subfamily)
MQESREIFSQIYDAYVDKIYRFAFLKVNSKDIAQDICSETFLKAWQVFKDEDRKIENPQAFLYQIARNLVIDHYREKGRSQVVSAEYASIIDPGQDLQEKSFQDSDLNAIYSTLTEIKPEYKEVIILHYVNDVSIDEISKMLNKSQGAVRTMLHRALKTVKSKIEES